MRAGALDRVIQIQRRTNDIDFYGALTYVWPVFATVRAQVLQFATDDREGARGNTTDAQITFRIRWIDSLTLEHRVVYQDKAFTIRQIKEIGRRVGLDITCERVGPQ